MSYSMKIGEEETGYTYNVSKMWYAASPGDGIRSHYGLTGKDAVAQLMIIYSYMVRNYDHLVIFNPDNGWGDYYGALEFVHKLIALSLQNPDEIWEGD